MSLVEDVIEKERAQSYTTFKNACNGQPVPKGKDPKAFKKACFETGYGLQKKNFDGILKNCGAAPKQKEGEKKYAMCFLNGYYNGLCLKDCAGYGKNTTGFLCAELCHQKFERWVEHMDLRLLKEKN